MLVLLVPQLRREYRDSFPVVQLIQKFILEGKKDCGLEDFDTRVQWTRTRAQIDTQITQTFEKFDTDHDDEISFYAFFMFVNELLERNDFNRRQFKLLLACVAKYDSEGGMMNGGSVHINEFKSLIFGKGWCPPSPSPAPKASPIASPPPSPNPGLEKEEELQHFDRNSGEEEASRESFSVLHNAAFNSLKQKAATFVPSPERKEREDDWFAGYHLHTDENL
jgi:hypothetical protein